MTNFSTLPNLFLVSRKVTFLLNQWIVQTISNGRWSKGGRPETGKWDKDQLLYPTHCSNGKITTIYKKKGSRFDLENDRGIFGLSVFKKIIDKLIYHEKYPLLDENMSDSNIGARRKKNIKTNLFIVYGVIIGCCKNNWCFKFYNFGLLFHTENERYPFSLLNVWQF